MNTEGGPTRERLEALIGDRIVAWVRLEPWSVMRCQLEQARTSVIVKWRRSGAVRSDPRQVLVEHAALTFLQDIGVASGPPLLASALIATAGYAVAFAAFAAITTLASFFLSRLGAVEEG